MMINSGKMIVNENKIMVNTPSDELHLQCTGDANERTYAKNNEGHLPAVNERQDNAGNQHGNGLQCHAQTAQTEIK
jgi:hypothetical protein